MYGLVVRPRWMPRGSGGPGSRAATITFAMTVVTLVLP